MEENWSSELSKYIKVKEQNQVEKTKTWEIAIGLQDVDGLKPSKYLIENVKEHIEGKIDLYDVERRIDNYYKATKKREQIENDIEEADKVSVRIAEVLSDKSFSFNVLELINIHKRLFRDIYDEAGKIRNYNFTKDEWVLNGDTVTYSSFDIIMDSLEYDFKEEMNFSYKNLSLDLSIKHFAKFISNIWQIHPFCEGNTRTTAVFFIKYLKTFGFDINNEVFANNSWYFRNSLVRANYKNFDKNVFEDLSYLEKFIYNLLTNSKYELKNRHTHIDFNKEKDLNKNDSIITLEEQVIINIIKSNSFIRQEEIAREINKSLRTVKTIMKNMQEKDLICRKNGKKDGEWIIL